MGRLTTHVLDTVSGKPAAQLKIELWKLNAPESSHPLDNADGAENTQSDISPRTLLVTTVTNADGRTDQPLLQDATFQPGCYELVFFVGDYFAKTAGNLPDPPFLDRVPIQFGIADPQSHYHVPLLASPWAYSTYRGS
jgi:5-hydroxyisourate hydrolase